MSKIKDFKNEYFYLLTDLKEVHTTIKSDKTKEECKSSGQILFKVHKGKILTPSLEALNLLIPSVPCEKGDSGLISLSLYDEKPIVKFNKKGSISAEFYAKLHYPLIDKIEGFQPLPEKEEEQDNLEPYIAKAKVMMKGHIDPFPIKTDEEIGHIGELAVELSISTALYYVQEIHVAGQGFIFWDWDFVKLLTIQPVFIKSSPFDNSPTGSAFDTL
ncbi:MAG: hypothetical protein ACFFD2_26475, partial [Promethearchaeota archaeon]